VSKVTLFQANVLDTWSLPDSSVQLIVLSPPYWGQRQYKTALWQGGDPACSHVKITPGRRGVYTSTLSGGKKSSGHQNDLQPSRCEMCGAVKVDYQLGAEPLHDCLGWAGGSNIPCGECFICHTLAWAREAWRVLRPDGVLLFNIGDSYAGSAGKLPGLKTKDLVLIPQRVALAMQAQGWWVRSEIEWVKLNPLPESVTDRPSKAHETIWMFTKSERYYWDHYAVKEPATTGWRGSRFDGKRDKAIHPGVGTGARNELSDTRNLRDVWSLSTKNYSGDHYACFPVDIPLTAIKAATSEAGACPTCGAPWTRVIRKGYRRPANEARIKAMEAVGVPRQKGNLYGSDGVADLEAKADNPDTTIGWLPSCQCYKIGLIPQVPERPDTCQDCQEIGCEGCAEYARLYAEWESNVVVIGKERERMLAEIKDTLPRVPCKVLDPFNGAGTTGLAALQLGRDYIGFDVSFDYLQQTRTRLQLDRIEAWGAGSGSARACDPLTGLPLFAGKQA